MMRTRPCTLGVFLAALPVFGMQPVAAADFLESPRQTFIAAYDKQDYRLFCSILDKDAAFRGAIRNQWTFTSDAIIKRFRAPCTCSEYAAKPTCAGAPLAAATPFTIGLTTLKLEPAGPAIASNPDKAGGAVYAMDSGSFEMVKKPGTGGVTTVGQYVILWIKDAAGWKMKHIDMIKTGD